MLREELMEKISQEYTLPADGVNLREVEKLCRPFMNELCSQPPQDWVEFSYDLLRSSFFPENFPVDICEGREEAAEFYLTVLNQLFERERIELPFDPCRDFQLLTSNEEMFCDILEEYREFRRCCREGYVYAFMRLSRECTPFNTLGHVAGVHHVAMYMARQLPGSEVAVDLGLMSGAALTHDMGKFGCRPSEAKRVPYLHYYYTYRFCRKYGLKTIGSIASNHSVWDLELENLSVESLLLIYADFRVKSVFDEQRREHIRFWTLDEAYDVILGKLDNVDEKKRRRYAKVYRKLKDLEEYLISLGCSVDLQTSKGEPLPRKNPVLMEPEEVVRRFQELAIRSNLSVMRDTWHADRFVILLEKIRSEKDWRHVRAYLTAIEEYSIYFPQEQKRLLLSFLYEMMSHRDGDIRRQAASIAGKMIADYEIAFTKEIPEGQSAPKLGETLDQIWEEFLNKVLSPARSMQERQIRWSGYALKSTLHVLLQRVDAAKARDILHIYISKNCDVSSDLIRFILIDCAAEIPCELCGEEDRERLAGFAIDLAKEKTGEIRVAAMWFLLLWLRQGWKSKENLGQILRNAMPDINQRAYCLRYVEARIREFYGIPSEHGVRVYDLTNLYLENQRAEIPWIYKYLNLEILKKRQAENPDTNQLYQYASHLLHMLQFGDRIVNRLQAGENLVDIMPKLEHAQRYEIMLELLRALEIGEYAVSKYIPQFLGKMMPLLPGKEQRYFLDKLRLLIGSINNKAAIVALEAVGDYLTGSPGIPCSRGVEEEKGGLPGSAAEEVSHPGSAADEDKSLRENAEGLLCMGLAHFDADVAQETFYIIGQTIFGSPLLTLSRKEEYFSDLARKLLSLTKEAGQGLYAYSRAAALNHIYRFLADSRQEGHTPMREKDLPPAFFPGTFDPFSLGHKAIVEEIRKMGYRIFLALDEFSWSKKAQPYEVRKNIMAMSCADMKDVYLFPEEIPINIANAQDMKRLRETLKKTKDVTIVVGSDVVTHASAYRKESCENSVRTFPHIIFNRNETSADAREMRGKISGTIQYVSLPAYFETVSSTRIRENITSGRDISDLVEEMVQNYIYRYGLYVMEPTYKKMASFLPIDTVIREGKEGGSHEIQIVDQGEGGKVCGSVCYREIDQMGLFDECGDVALAAFLRSRLSGKIAVITDITGTVSAIDDKRLTALNEALVYFQANSFSYALCFCYEKYSELLSLHGFVSMDPYREIGMSDLRMPMVLFYDTPASFKETMSGNEQVRLAVRTSHLRLLRSMAGLYPGQLILCFESNVMNYRLMKKITRENGVEMQPDPDHRLGEKMCVPFGKILKGVRIPNTVTKGLDTEKVYDPDLQHFSIEHFPGYAPLNLQIRAIKSFQRPVILTDDLYHSGYRAREIDACMAAEGMPKAELVVGVLSGRGRDLAREKGKKVEAIYSVPNMRAWLIESDLYPFIGGDGVKTKLQQTTPPLALSSVNTILPYEMPAFLGETSVKAMYHLSQTCLENAGIICRALEKEYSSLYGRRLTMERISEVMTEPRYPDVIGFDEETLQEVPSEVLERELQRLRRLGNLRKDL